MENNYKLAHVGINCKDEEEAIKTASFFEAAFGLPVKVGNSSVFAGSAVECMKTPYLGEKGHIAIACPDLRLAIADLKEKGIEVDLTTQKTNKEGKPTAIYLKGEYCGFAVHLVEKA